MVKKNRSKAKKPLSGNQQDSVLSNSLSGLVGALGFSKEFGTQISQIETIIKNNRYHLISNDRTTLSYMYTTHGIVQTLIDQPVNDGFRGGIKIRSSQLSPDNIQELESYIEENNIVDTIKQAFKWSRLFGGAGLVVDAGQNSSQPFNIDSVNKNTNLSFTAADLWELNNNIGGGSSEEKERLDHAKRPQYGYASEKFLYYGTPLHRSRVLLVKGKEAPSLIAPQTRGFGMSEVDRLVRSINSYMKNMETVFELLDEAKIDVWKMQGFNDALLDPSRTQAITTAVQKSNEVKNYNNGIVMDSEDEYQQKQIQFTGLSEMLNDIRKGIACDMQMPLTKIFGISAAGFNSGEDDLENYNSMVEGEIRSKAKGICMQVVQILCRKLFEYIPDDIQIEFQSLRVLSSEQEEQIKNHKLNRLLMLFDRGVISTEQLIEACNSDNISSIELQETFGESLLEEEESDNLTNKNVKIFRGRNE